MKSRMKIFLFTKDLKYVKINSLYPVYLIFSKVNGYFERINKSKYLALVIIVRGKKKWKNIKNFGVKLKIWLGQ